jgi:16S rRNA (adenine1518-N6/adenine1519-N6)-dimethyltransferase
MEHQPRKRFGQNFLVDQRVIQRILLALNPQPGDHFVEIGPGLGALTNGLIGQTKRLDVVEIDRDLGAKLRSDFVAVGCPSCHVHVADALDFDFTVLLTESHGAVMRGGNQASLLRVCGNLPYNITTPLLFHLIAQIAAIKDMHFMVQREVAERIVALPGSKVYGRLSVMMQYYCQADILFDVPPGAFNPPPQVHSSFIRLQPLALVPVLDQDMAVRQRRRLVVHDMALFANVVRLAFNQRRKIIRNGLKELMIAESQWQALQIDPQTRPEQLSVENFIAISNIIAAQHAA